MAVSFGVVTAPGSYGLAQNVETTDTVEMSVAKSALGVGTNEKAHTRKKSISFEYVLDGTPPAAGSTITVDTVAYTVTSTKLSETNDDFKKMSVEAETNVVAMPT